MEARLTKGLLGVLSLLRGIGQIMHLPLGQPDEARANMSGLRLLVLARRSE